MMILTCDKYLHALSQLGTHTQRRQFVDEHPVISPAAAPPWFKYTVTPWVVG